MKNIVTLLLLIFTVSAFTQTGIGTTTPSASAQLEVASTTKGFLLPRMTLTQMNAISSPAVGLLIWNTTTETLNQYQTAGWAVIASRDANANLLANNHLNGFTSIVTANEGVTTLVVGSTYAQQFVGSHNHTVTLPVASTLTVGQSFLIMNRSTGAVTVNSSGANLVQLMAASSQVLVTCSETSQTTAFSWDAAYSTTSSGATNIDGLSDAKTSGSNLYLGDASGSSNTTGANNVAVGPYTLNTGRYGSKNVAVGPFALTSTAGESSNPTLGSLNTALGYYSLLNNSNGSKNIAIGANAGEKISTGPTNNASNNSIFIGVDTKPFAAAQTNQIVIGDAAVGNGSNTVTIGNGDITDNYFSGNIQSASFKVSALNTAPVSATAAGTLGEIRVTATYIYVCTATNTWVRSALSTW